MIVDKMTCFRIFLSQKLIEIKFVEFFNGFKSYQLQFTKPLTKLLRSLCLKACLIKEVTQTF
jgi:hypothetical protein